MPRFSVTSSSLRRGTLLADAANFWTGATGSIDRIPGSVQNDTNWTASTYKTLLNLSAAGFVSAFIGPTLPTAADTNTWRITVDGAQYTVTLTAQNNADRCVLGFAQPVTLYTVTTGPVWLAAGVASDNMTTNIDAQTETNLMDPNLLVGYQGAPLLQFNSSLLVEAQISVNLTTTTARERRSGVMLYRIS